MSQAIWLKKLKTWVPSWVFEKEKSADAIFKGMAEVLSQIEDEYQNHLRETFICDSEGEFLDEHGSERSKIRKAGELDPSFRLRIKRITSSVDCISLKEIIDEKLINGESTIIENYNGQGNFINNDCFADNGTIPNDFIYNSFTAIIPNQTPAPQSFTDNEYFSENEHFIGSVESPLELFNLIIDCMNENKAFGTFCRIYERRAA